MTYTALVVDKNEKGYVVNETQLDMEQLPEGNVTVRVEYSSVNYKDALAITGRGPVVRKFPMVPGIDLAGVVEESRDPAWRAGDRVVLNGWGVGESHPGGFAQMARVRGEWLVRRPDVFSARQAMSIGTAGYTAMLCVMALEKHGVKPDDGDVLVTGANGGVGSLAVALLSKMGFRVVASTGRLHEQQYLKSLGANAVINRDELSSPGKPLQKERWAAVVDCVGSHTLANACAGVRYGGAVAACGLAQGMDFPSTVAPFILRAVTLYGIDSVMASSELRNEAWNRLAREIDLDRLEAITTEAKLSDVKEIANSVLNGLIRGRIAVNLEN